MTRRVVGFDYPAHISVEKQRYGFGTQTHLEKMVILEKWYSDLRAYLPKIYKQYKTEDELKELMVLLKEVDEDIDVMNETYDPTFEGLLSCNPSEKVFNKIMRTVHQRLDVITANSGILDKVIMGDDGEAAYGGM